MDHHPPPAGARRPGRPSGSDRTSLARPVRSPRPLRSAALGPALALVLVLVLAGCSNGDADGDTLAERLADTGAAESTADEDETITLGDPGDVEGFAPVEDVEVEPAEAPTAESVDLGTEEPEAVIDEVAEQLETSTVDDDAEVLDAVEPVDQASDEAPVDDGRPRNEVGELLSLDEEASLACAQVEIAIGHIDEGLPAAATERIVSGAERAEASGVADIRAWVDPLRAVVADGPAQDLAPLVGFLSVCTEGGYEL